MSDGIQWGGRPSLQPPPRPPVARKPPAPEWLTRQEAARYLRVSEETMRRLILRGDIRAARIGRQFRIRRTDFDAYLRKIHGTNGAA